MSAACWYGHERPYLGEAFCGPRRNRRNPLAKCLHSGRFDLTFGNPAISEIARRKATDLARARCRHILLIAGFWTPVAGVVVACAEAWMGYLSPTHAGIPLALAILGVTLALIGPGEWSVDARFYGRKHFARPSFRSPDEVPGGAAIDFSWFFSSGRMPRNVESILAHALDALVRVAERHRKGVSYRKCSPTNCFDSSFDFMAR